MMLFDNQHTELLVTNQFADFSPVGPAASQVALSTPMGYKSPHTDNDQLNLHARPCSCVERLGLCTALRHGKSVHLCAAARPAP